MMTHKWNCKYCIERSLKRNDYKYIFKLNGMKDEDLLKENGWEIECESPFEIRHEDGSFATINAAYSVVDELKLSGIMGSILLIKNSYKAELIDKDTFINKMIEVLEKK